MIFTDHLEELHAKIPGALPIDKSTGTATFAFPDPEGNYFVFAQA